MQQTKIALPITLVVLCQFAALPLDSHHRFLYGFQQSNYIVQSLIGYVGRNPIPSHSQMIAADYFAFTFLYHLHFDFRSQIHALYGKLQNCASKQFTTYRKGSFSIFIEHGLRSGKSSNGRRSGKCSNLLIRRCLYRFNGYSDLSHPIINHFQTRSSYNRLRLLLYRYLLIKIILHVNAGIAFRPTANGKDYLIGNGKRLFGDKPDFESKHLVSFQRVRLCIQQLHFTIFGNSVPGNENLFGSHSSGLHKLAELYFDTSFITMHCRHIRLCILHQANIYIELRRRHGQPFAISGLITLFFVLHLPLTDGYIPSIHTVLIGSQRVLLCIVFRIPQFDLLVQVAIHIFLVNLLIDSSSHSLKAI